MTKYRIRKTGEIVDVISSVGSTQRNEYRQDKVSYIDSKGYEHPDVHMNLYWDFEEVDNKTENPIKQEINWEERRYEIAKAVLPEAIRIFENSDPVIMAVSYADDLIKLLKDEMVGTKDSDTLSDSAFWQDLYNKMNNDPRWVRINGKSFIFTGIDDVSPKGWNKCGNLDTEGYAKLKNGNAIHSNNIWFQGEVPEEFKKLMPDNAEWISKKGFDNADIVGYPLGCGIVFTDRVKF